MKQTEPASGVAWSRSPYMPEAERVQPVVACRHCDWLNGGVPLRPRQVARCRRCRATLYRATRDGIERTLALASTALVLLVVSNVFPFLSLAVRGDMVQATLGTGVRVLWNQDMQLLAGLVFLTAIAAPTLQIGLLLYVLLPLRLGRTPWKLPACLRVLRHVEPWSMMEIFMLGTLVSLVKLRDLAEVVPGPALVAFTLLIFVLAGAAASLDHRVVWSRVEIRA